jgi:uncharacterized protein
MSLKVNLCHLEEDSVRLEGELSAEELDIETRDEVIVLTQPLTYNLEVQKFEGGLLVQGALQLPLDCQCVRCLKPFTRLLELPDYRLHVPLQGEDAAPVANDLVDLTPAIREDILLEFPQHPLCDPECWGLLPKTEGGPGKTNSSEEPELSSSAWAELNKLKFEK